jgi:hypothetical protein
VDGGGGVAHWKWRRRGGDHQWVLRWGKNGAHGALLVQAYWGEEKGGNGVPSARRCANDVPTRKEGGLVRGQGQKSRADRGGRKRGAYHARGVACAAPCRGHASAAHVGPTTDGVHRTRSDSDPTSVARSPGTGAMPNQVFQLLKTTRGLTFLSRSSLSSFSL